MNVKDPSAGPGLPSNSCQLRNLDTGEAWLRLPRALRLRCTFSSGQRDWVRSVFQVRPFAMDSLTQSFVVCSEIFWHILGLNRSRYHPILMQYDQDVAVRSASPPSPAGCARPSPGGSGGGGLRALRALSSMPSAPSFLSPDAFFLHPGQRRSERQRCTLRSRRPFGDTVPCKDERLLQAAAEGNSRMIHELTHPSDGGPPAGVHAHCKSGAALGRGPLHLAVASGVTEAVEVLLAQGADVNSCSKKIHLTALHVASAYGSSEMVDLLLEARADPLAKTEDKQLALHYAAANGHMEIVKMLLQKEGASQVGFRNSSGQRPVEAACDLQTVYVFRAFEAAQRCEPSGSRRNSASSEASTATGSSDGQFTSEIACPPCSTESSQDSYDRTPLSSGFLLRNARTDAVHRLMHLTRQLDEALSDRDARDGRTLSAKSFKAASPKDSPGRSPSASSGTSTPKIRTPFARMRQGSSRVEKVGPNSFELVNLLGRGSFGEVFQVKHKRTGKAYAMKVLQKSRIMSSNLLRYAVTERNILAYIRHPYIVSLHYAFQTPSHLVLVLQYCPRGNLQSSTQHLHCSPCSRIFAGCAAPNFEALDHTREAALRRSFSSLHSANARLRSDATFEDKDTSSCSMLPLAMIFEAEILLALIHLHERRHAR